MDKVDVIVIGAGVVGLAVAAELTTKHPQASIAVLDKEQQFGWHTSSRNSEVVHGGMYYPTGSLKAKLCVEGRPLLYEFCEKYAIPVYYIICTSEASANLARYDGIRYGLSHKDADNLLDVYAKTRERGFGGEVKRRIMLGTYSLSSGYYDAYYLKAKKVQQLIKDEFRNAFNECDVLISPTTPSEAFKIGEKTKDPVSMYLSDIFTVPANIAGLPAISLPITRENALPFGLQLTAKQFNEKTLLSISYLLEKAL